MSRSLLGREEVKDNFRQRELKADKTYKNTWCLESGEQLNVAEANDTYLGRVWKARNRII